MYGVMVITLLAGSWKALTGILIVETEVDEEFVDDSDVDEGGFVDDASIGGSLAAAMAIAAGICDNWCNKVNDNLLMKVLIAN